MSISLPLRCIALAAILLVPAFVFGQDQGIDASRLPGIVVDDTAAKQVGTWSPSKHTRPFVGANYIYSAGGAGQTSISRRNQRRRHLSGAGVVHARHESQRKRRL